MQYHSLGTTGLQVSTIGFGASPFGNVFGKVTDNQCQEAIDAAMAGGINFFDVSPYYGSGLAEERLGRALAGKRSSILLATKCGRNGVNDFDFSADGILRSLEQSLQRLQTSYIDLLQAHDVEFADPETVLRETLPAMLDLQNQGKVRCIGITSYQLQMLARLASECTVDTALSYCRYNLLAKDLDQLLLPVLQQRGVGLINASPFHMGLLTEAGPPSWHPAPDVVKQAARKIVAACLEHGIAPSQIALRFCLDHPYVSTTLVGMASAEQVEENLRALTLPVDRSLIARLNEIVNPVQDIVWPSGLPQNFDQPLRQEQP